MDMNLARKSTMSNLMYNNGIRETVESISTSTQELFHGCSGAITITMTYCNLFSWSLTLMVAPPLFGRK